MRTLQVIILLSSVAGCMGVHAQNADRISALPEENFRITGSWDCEGTFRGDKVHKSTFTGALILDGKWVELTEQDVQPATGYVAEYLIGYDAQKKQLVEFDANNFSAATYASDQGWRNGVLTMTSPISQDSAAPYAANRFLYSITGPDAFTVDWQISKTSNLDWVPADHLACRRRAHT
jgi:hypothetical protein